MRAPSDHDRTPSLWHRWLLAPIVPVILVAAVAWSQRASPPAWQMVEVRIADIKATVSAIGMVRPLRSVDLCAQISGQLEKLHLAAGDVVMQGRLLAEIDPKVMQAPVGRQPRRSGRPAGAISAQRSDQLAKAGAFGGERIGAGGRCQNIADAARSPAQPLFRAGHVSATRAGAAAGVSLPLSRNWQRVEPTCAALINHTQNRRAA